MKEDMKPCGAKKKKKQASKKNKELKTLYAEEE